MKLFRILFAVVAMATLTIPTIESSASEIQFVEDFVLAKDRTKAIEQLIPGTDVYYFYQCIHLQNNQKYDEVDKLLTQWQQRHGESQTFKEIRHRQMLLTYSTNPTRTLDYLINELQPNLNHQRDRQESKPQLPTKLDQARISHETLKKEALGRHQGLNGFEDRALDDLRESDLNPMRRRELLTRLNRPTHPDLVDLILADLQYEGSRGFGSLEIHRLLLLEQLDELISRRPAIENESQFVNTYLQKLQPSPDVDWQNDPAEMEAYLERLWGFVGHLNASHNSLKAHVLYHWLVLDETRGSYDKNRFLMYLALPRQTHYVAPRLLQDAEARRYPVDLGMSPGSVTELPPIHHDEPLVRRYFLHFFQTENNYSSYLPYVKDDYLSHLFAEAKITNGLGNPEKWYALLPPAKYQELKDRVDLDFAPTNPRVFRGDDPVQLDVYVKNVDKLIVKVYEVNTRNYYQQFAREVNTDIELDGLVANHEVTHRYEDAPVIRRRRHFEFPELEAPGVYVIDLIGNGKSSRAVVRKGQLHYVSQINAAGHVFHVFNDKLESLKDVSLWMSGQQFESEADGSILVPFSTSPGRQPIVLTHGNLSSLHFFQHESENYQFNVAAHIDREALLDRQEAVVLLRPELRLSGIPVSTKVLEDVQVTIQSTNLDGVQSEKTYSDVNFFENKDTPLVFLVPSRLAAIQINVTAKVTDARKDKQSLAASYQVQVNQIDQSDKIEDLHLTKIGDVYVLELLGKTGEAKAHRPVNLQLRHQQFRDVVNVNLATDENGLVQLGELEGITHITANGPTTPAKNWPLRSDRRTITRTIHARRGEVVRVPHMKGPRGLRRDQVTLYELRGGSYAKDVSKSVTITDNFVELEELSAGDYSLDVDGQLQHIEVVAGRKESGFVLGDLRRAELRRLPPVQLTSITSDDKHLKIQLDNASEFTRVHVYATRYVPAFDPYEALSAVREVEPLTMTVPANRSYYMAGRKLGDELQYVLERAYAKKYPGNMLERPTLLLNSWPMRGTETATQTAAVGEAFDAAAAPPSAAAAAREKRARLAETGLTDFANLDFLAEPTMLAANQKPDEQGTVSIELEDLGPHQHFHVVAIDPLTTVYRSMALPNVTMAKRDLRLHRGLDAKRHYTQQKTITQLTAGEKFELADITTGRFETYDSLASVYALYSTLSGNEVLGQFRFMLDWPKLSSDEKRDKYSEFACHELNFFLYKKDPAFFTEVIRPYIENKQHKTFLDLWLLEADLAHFLEPWRYKQLNTAERLLLGERIDGEDARVQRLIDDLFGLIPRDVRLQNLWFDTAILGKALDIGTHFQGASARIRDFESLQELGLQERAAYGIAANGGIAEDQDGLLRKAEQLARESKSRLRRSQSQVRMLESEALMSDDSAVLGDKFFGGRADRSLRRQLYEKLEKTQEWAENNYYRLPIEQQDENLIQVNAFWNDFAKRRKNEPFFSIHWPAATRNFSEMMFARSLLDLPLEGVEHETKFEEQRMTFTAAGPMVVFQEQIREAEWKDEDSPILITQNLFRADDRFQMIQGVRRDKFVTDEFLVHVVYGCQVVLTNPTSTQRKVQLLIQIPHESMATNGGKATKTVDFDLAPYHTETVDYFFYFPAAGEYQHFPAHVAQDETLLAYANPAPLTVVDTPSNINKQSWDYVSQFGSDDEVLTYLREHNVFEMDLARIAFRMMDKPFFEKAISLLKDRHAYSAVLWAYGLKHNDPETIATFLKHNDQFLAACGETLNSELIEIDPVVRRTYQHLDYKPLVNARAHRLGGRRQILNDRFFEQYHNLLEVLKYRRELNNEDRIAMTYYLLLQDHIEEAIAMFSTVERSNLESQIQYDYFAAYLDCFRDELTQARAIVTRYVNYPVPKWQHAFASVKGILDELDGHNVLVVDPKDRTQTQTAAAAEQTNFTFTVEDREVRIDYQNVGQLQVNYYLIDLELLFSSNPFVQKFSGQFSHIRPHDTAMVSLPADGKKLAFELPEDLHNRNILVEIVGDGITRSQAYFSNSLTVQVSENYGQLSVTETASGKPLPKTYVKVYSEMNDGRTLFYKDGYTDLRGRFDYSSLSTNELDFVKRFSILVLDDARGGLVREAQVPKR